MAIFSSLTWHVLAGRTAQGARARAKSRRASLARSRVLALRKFRQGAPSTSARSWRGETIAVAGVAHWIARISASRRDWYAASVTDTRNSAAGSRGATAWGATATRPTLVGQRRMAALQVAPGA